MSEETNVDLDATGKLVADALHEVAKEPRTHIRRIIELCGIEDVMRWLDQAQRVYADGGMLTANGKRKRTLGGVFFYLAKQEMPEETRAVLWPPPLPRAERAKVEAKKQEVAAAASILGAKAAPPFDYAQRMELVYDLTRDQIGEATTVKITLLGRPSDVIVRRDLVIFAMENTYAPKTMPPGLPPIPSEPTKYLVYATPGERWKAKGESRKELWQSAKWNVVPPTLARKGACGALSMRACPCAGVR